jgi:hypothetical protein
MLLEDALDVAAMAAALRSPWAVPPRKWVDEIGSENEIAGFAGLF